MGGDSTLGRGLLAHLQSDRIQFWATTRRSRVVKGEHSFLDLKNDVQSWKPPSSDISVAVICAGIASIQSCHEEPHETRLVNVINTIKLAEKLRAKGTFVLYPSTNLVFDGSIPNRKAGDPVCPTTEYGRQKAEVERQLLSQGELASVVRFTKILSPELPLFNGWIELLQSGNVIHPFSDMVMAPIGIDLAVEVLMSVIHSRLSGIIQVSGPKDISYAQVASHIAMRLRVSEDLIEPITSNSSNLQLNAAPLHTTLDVSRLRSDFRLEQPDIWATIDKVYQLQ